MKCRVVFSKLANVRDNRMAVTTAIAFLLVELALFYCWFVRPFGTSCFLVPSGAFLGSYFAFIAIPGVVNVIADDWSHKYESYQIFLAMTLVSPLIIMAILKYRRARIRPLLRNMAEVLLLQSGVSMTLVVVTTIIGGAFLAIYAPSYILDVARTPGVLYDQLTALELRFDATRDLMASGGYLHYALIRVLLPVSCCVTIWKAKCRYNLIDVGLAAVVIVLGMALSALNLNKYPFLALAVTCLIAYLYPSRKPEFQPLKRQWRSYLTLGSAALVGAVLIAVMWSIYDPREANWLDRLPTFRMFYVPSWCLIDHFEYVDRYGLQGFSTIGRAAWLLDVPFQNVANEIFRWHFPGASDVNTANACFIGLAYVGWGIPGVLLFSICVGLYIHFFESLGSHKNPSKLTVALQLAGAINMCILVSGDLPSFLLTHGGILFLALAWVDAEVLTAKGSRSHNSEPYKNVMRA